MAVRDTLEPAVHVDPLIGPSAAAPGDVLSHRFVRPELLREALTHRSAAHGRQSRHRPGQGSPGQGSPGQGSNERLEFIGDRVLGLVIAEWLAERFPDEQEGQLGPRHAQLVSRPVLAEIGERAGLDVVLSVAPNEARTGVRRLSTVLADTMEAVIGAVYLDSGLAAARDVVRRAWAPAMEAQIRPPKDAKTALQEWVLARGQKLPAYQTVGREGPPHAPRFTVSVSAAGEIGTGIAGSKREAERDAAADLLGKIAPAAGPQAHSA